MEYYSVIKKNEIRPFSAIWMDLENVVLSELSKTETENHHMTSFISRIQKEMIQMNLQNRETHRLRKRTSGC